MIESKPWNWDANASDFWRTVAAEFLPVVMEWKAKGFTRALDLGCGLGRNAIFLAQNGFEVTAFDLSAEGVAELERRAAKLGLRIDAAVGDMLSLPYENDSFDGVVAFHSIYHTDLEGLRRVVAEIRRVVRPGGELFVTLNSKASDAWKIFSRNKIGEYTIIKTEGPEVDVPHTYLEYQDVTELLKDFAILKIQETFDFWHKWKYAHFFVLCKKPESL